MERTAFTLGVKPRGTRPAQPVECEAVFEFPKTRMVGITCPDCGSMDVRIAE